MISALSRRYLPIVQWLGGYRRRDLPGDTMAGLIRLLHKFEDPATPYLSQPRPMFLGRFGDYDHLARVKEWRGRR